MVLQNCFSYDTTFNIGDFYLSALTALVTTMQEAPCIAVAFVIHERKFESVHRAFCKNLKKRLLSINARVVTDGEVAIIKAFKDVFQTWFTVGCWNHVLSDVEMWLQKHQGQQHIMAIYKSHIREFSQ
jgi:hypothetical protein